jgi:hypothetical protein
MLKKDRMTYKILKALPCCYNCKHSYTRMGLSLYCNNREEWVKEASVQPCGICEGYEVKES